MSARVATVSALARRDLDDHAAWLHGNVDPDTASRFAEQVEATLARIAQAPGLGPPVASRRAELAGLRKRTVDGFRVIAFYRPSLEGAEIVRVLHAAQNWTSSLDVP